MKLIVGLGNPGREYEGTRHNAGFHWVDRLAELLQITLKPETRFHGLCARTQGDSEIWLLEPQTYMNVSGRSVSAVCQFYKIPIDKILIVHDELDLPPGTVKLKKGGGLGGHNGLKDIAAKLGTQDFWRLRIGIGHPGDRGAVVGYVLHPPGKEDAQLIGQAIEKSLEVWPLLVKGNCEAAMLKLHTKI
jgi:PTH1 family peptidyl-tRNA hydrolase